MSSTNNRRHVYISHHADDLTVNEFTSLLLQLGYDISNGSIRIKPANQQKLEQGLVNPKVIQRLLRRKMLWASTIVVFIGDDNPLKTWVDWEIEQAHRQGKRVIGVYEQDEENCEVPDTLEKYGCAIVGWDIDSIINAVDGDDNQFQAPDCSPRPVVHIQVSVRC